MARIPMLERAYGQTELARIHGAVGIGFVAAMTTHIFLFAAALPPSGPSDDVTELLRVVGMTSVLSLAAVASVTFLVAAGASARRIRDKLGYERWHLLHASAYFALGLAIPHELAFGTAIRTAWGRAFFGGLILTAYALILVFRLGVPTYRYWAYRPECYRVEHDSQGHQTSLYIRGAAGCRKNLGQLGYRSGHFAILRFMVRGLWVEAHPGSISASPKFDELRFTFTDEDHRWYEMLRNAPAPVVLEGPFGRLHRVDLTAKLALFAGGIGVTPLRAMLEDLPLTSDVVFLYRVKDDLTAALRAEVNELAESRGVRLVWLVGPRGKSHGGPSWLPAACQHCRTDVDNMLLEIPDIKERQLVIVGPKTWTNIVQHVALEAGVSKKQIQMEPFTW
ncbi:ferric reductase-like transmembrane domain-containing protein [Microlunatus ginsengisoli]|uniref:Ferric reductase-like transmembrane domain-containing protein n=2 Tax=Microlunatus ginsengisoli TaxID=363863 RepID=A0ABP6ZLE3_9ACTN